jgi:hypothetical protein
MVTWLKRLKLFYGRKGVKDDGFTITVTSDSSISLHYLGLVHRRAVSIDRYFAEMAEAGVSIAENTSHIKALKDTIQVATTILSVAGNINNHSATIKDTLATRAGKATTDGQGGA